MTTERIDVLAMLSVIETTCFAIGLKVTAEEVREVRAAVTELAKAANSVYRLHMNCETNRYAITNAYSDLSAALAKVGAA